MYNLLEERRLLYLENINSCIYKQGVFLKKFQSITPIPWPQNIKLFQPMSHYPSSIPTLITSMNV